MSPSTTYRILLFLTTLVVVPIATIAVILFARGYRPNLATRQLQPTGLLVAQSYPDGAQIFVNGQLRSATNTTLNLSPGPYVVEIKKEGFHPWQKNVIVEAEVVTRATATLFPSVPTLKAITTTGAVSPTLSPDGTKVVYLSTSSTRLNIYSLDLSESPLGLINRDPKLVTSLNLSDPKNSFTLTWSPDSRQVLLTVKPLSAAYLVDLGSSTISDASLRSASLLTQWQEEQKIHEAQKFLLLPELLQNILASSSAHLVWSPKENKLLYTATASAILPDNIKKPLPGSNSQPQERHLVPNSVYVYDLEEDRNFLLGTPAGPSPAPSKTPLLSTSQVSNFIKWFPSSSHLFKVEDHKVVIFEYDYQNPTVVYAGPMEEDLAIPYPSGKQLLILTRITRAPTPATTSALPNLYAVSLR